MTRPPSSGRRRNGEIVDVGQTSHSGVPVGKPAQTVCFLVFPGFSLVTLGVSLEPLRIANEIARREIYDIHVVAGNALQTVDANGLAIQTRKQDHLGDVTPDLVILCAGSDLHPEVSTDTRTWLRKASRHGATIGAIGTAVFVLAGLGLLDGYACSLHWTYAPAFRESYPDVKLSNGIYEVDRNRMTAAAATAGMDMILSLVEKNHGGALASKVSDLFLHSTIRPSDDRQNRIWYTGLKARSNILWQAIQIMEQNTEVPLKTCAIAERAGVTARQLERLFSTHVRTSPARFYREIRLQNARQLVQGTSLSLKEISLVSGFASHSNFAKCYRFRFDRTPSEDRLLRADSGDGEHASADDDADPETFVV